MTGGRTSLESRPRASFVGITYAGWKTRQTNLEVNVRADGRLDATFHRVTGWNDDGCLERSRLPAGLAGRIRGLSQTRAFSRFPRPDVLWTSAPELVLPHLWAYATPWRRPLIVETDWTIADQEAWAQLYFQRAPKTGLRLRTALMAERAIFRSVSHVVTMSRWAAGRVAATGFPAERITVIHPGLDLNAWPAQKPEFAPTGPLRVLFVGGNFHRKGGDLLLDMVRGPFAGRIQLDIVTRDDIAPAPGVRIHRAETNSPELRALYARAELFAMPTRAECFGQVVVEAFASGLPAIVGDVGGTSDIVDHGETGWLISPDGRALAAAMEDAIDRRACLPEMGIRARRVAEQRFDGKVNDARLVNVMLHEIERLGRNRGRGRG